MWLRLESGDLKGTLREVTSSVQVGREPSCDVVLEDGRVSRQHAAFDVMPDGSVTVRDLGSSNGTFVNGVRIEAPTVLLGGEEIQVGDTVMSVSNGMPTIIGPGDGTARTIIGPGPAPVLAPSPIESVPAASSAPAAAFAAEATAVSSPLPEAPPESPPQWAEGPPAPAGGYGAPPSTYEPAGAPYENPVAPYQAPAALPGQVSAASYPVPTPTPTPAPYEPVPPWSQPAAPAPYATPEAIVAGTTAPTWGPPTPPAPPPKGSPWRSRLPLLITIVAGVVAVAIVVVFVLSNRGETPPPEPVATLGPPQELSATALSHDRVSLVWKAPAGSVQPAAFTVYRDGQEVGNVEPSTLHYVDSSVQASTTYRYAVDAVDGAGKHSQKSNEVSATTPEEPAKFTVEEERLLQHVPETFRDGCESANDVKATQALAAVICITEDDLESVIYELFPRKPAMTRYYNVQVRRAPVVKGQFGLNDGDCEKFVYAEGTYANGRGRLLCYITGVSSTPWIEWTDLNCLVYAIATRTKDKGGIDLYKWWSDSRRSGPVECG